MKFSFIIGTINRTRELKYCIESLLTQSYREFEIIIVDQSENDLTEKLVKSFNEKCIIYNHVSFKGLSKARNYGISIATGEYICLTDDDACYDIDYLSMLKGYYEKEPNWIISGHMWDAVNKREFIDYSRIREGEPLSVRDIIRKCPSPAITFPKCIVQEIEGFDENFGVGAKYGAGEETDFLLRAFWIKYDVIYCEDVRVQHPHEYAMIAVDEEAEDRKAFNYPYGIGAMYKKQFVLGDKKKMMYPYVEQILKMIIKKILHKSRAELILKRFQEGFNSYNRELEGKLE